MKPNQKGMSIIELLIAAGLTALVAFGAASMIYGAQKTSQFSTVQNDLDRIHYLNLQIARNISNIQTLYGISDDPSVPLDPNNILLNCLQMNPKMAAKCTIDNLPSYTITPQTQGSLHFPQLVAAPNVASAITITPNCSAAIGGCDFITIDVVTTYTGGSAGAVNNSFVHRESKANLANYLFIPRNEITYTDCSSSGEMLVGIDYYNQQAICNKVQAGMDGTTNISSGALPLIIYDSGAGLTTGQQVSAVNNTICANGYADGGFFESTCRTSTGLTAPPPVTTTSTTLPVAGTCGLSNGQTMSSAPTTGLCGIGTPSAVAGSGPWTWTCSGAPVANCSASVASASYTAQTICFYASGFSGGSNCQPGSAAVWGGGATVMPDPPALGYNVTINYNSTSQAFTFTSMGAGSESVSVGGKTFIITITGGTTNNCPAANPSFTGSCLVHGMGSVSGPF